MSLVLFVMLSVIRVKDNFFFELVEGEKNFENIPEWAEAKNLPSNIMVKMKSNFMCHSSFFKSLSKIC